MSFCVSPQPASLQTCSRSISPRLSGPARPCGRGKLAQFSLLQRYAVWDRAGIQQQLRAYGGRHNGETDRENRASLDRLERTTKDVCFLVSILQVREQVVSFYVSFPESALNASIALIVSIPRHASMDGLSLPSSSGRDH